MSRFTASFYHFLISLAVFLVIAYLMLTVWYPGFFYDIDGGWEGMRIIIGVDLILGPVLTLVVFKAGKPGLKFDLAAIGFLQAACLTAGLYIVYAERPLFLVYYEKHFYTATADTFEEYGVPPVDPFKYADATPALVAARVPDDPIEEADFRKALYDEGIPVWVSETSYEPLKSYMDRVIEQAPSSDEVRQRDTHGVLAAWLSKNSGTIDDYAFIPTHARYGKPYIAVSRADKRLIDAIQITQNKTGK